MCPLAWLSRTDGFTLWHSRDERRSRGVGIPPLVEHGSGVSWTSPRDSDSGGTWVGINTCGVSVGIANLFTGGAPRAPGRKVSRGLLVRQLLDSPSILQVERRIRSFDLVPYEPFTLVSLATGRAPVILRWDRSELAPVAPLGPVLLVTSAGGNRSIEEGRARLFEPAGSTALDPEQIELLYRRPPSNDDAAVCVHRPEVSTVSLSRIEVNPLHVSLIYTPGQPCQTAPGPVILLDRISA